MWLCLHGFLGRGADWRGVQRHLPEGCELRAPDLPGHGQSRGLDAGAYSIDGAADRLAATVDEPVDVVGYSMGGRVALHVALRHPSRVRRLVLVSASPGLETDAERAARRAVDAERAAEIVADFPAFMDHWYRMPLFALPDERRQRLTADRLAHNDPDELARALVGIGTGSQPSHWDALRGISVPTLAVAGALDSKYVALTRRMAEADPVQAAVVPGVGHAVHAEAPDALATLLTQFLTS